MIAGIVAASAAVNAQAAPVFLWTPLNMATVPQIYLDVQDSVVTDVGGACSAISNLGAMGSAGDFSQATVASRPAILGAELNGKRVLRFDGVNDFLAGDTSAHKDIFRNVSAAWIYIVYKKRAADTSPITRRFFHASNDLTTGAVRLAAHVGISTGTANAPALSVRRLDTEAQSDLGSSAPSGINYNIALFHVDFSTREGAIYTNGAHIISNASLISASGTTSDTSSGRPLSIGARYDGIVAADVDVAAVVIGNSAIPMGDRQKLEGWAAHKYGLTANLPANHPYKTVAPTV